jgi:hypothetical protein
MNTESRQAKLDWVPASGFQLRKAGVQFDAVRVDGVDGRRLADFIEELTDGDPGPIVIESSGWKSVYFLVPAGSTSHRHWPRGTIRLNAGPCHVSYVPVPALHGLTWPIGWRVPPTADNRFVHTALLNKAACTLLE